MSPLRSWSRNGSAENLKKRRNHAQNFPKLRHFFEVKWQNSLPRLSFSVKNEEGETYLICAQNFNTKEQLTQVMEGSRGRAILAFGTNDLDIYKARAGVFMIDWSPCPGASLMFEVSEQEFEKIMREE